MLGPRLYDGLRQARLRAPISHKIHRIQDAGRLSRGVAKPLPVLRQPPSATTARSVLVPSRRALLLYSAPPAPVRSTLTGKRIPQRPPLAFAGPARGCAGHNSFHFRPAAHTQLVVINPDNAEQLLLQGQPCLERPSPSRSAARVVSFVATVSSAVRASLWEART